MSVNLKYTKKKPLGIRFQSSSAMILLASVLTFTILFSCQKNRADTIASTPAQIETLANKWLDSKHTVEPGERNQRVEQIRKLLDFANSYTEDAGKGKTYLIIPIKDGFVSAYNKDKAPQNYLLLTQNFNGKVLKGNIVQFISSAKKIPANTFRAMDELKKVSVDGSFTFLTLFDRYLYSETYKNGKFFSFTEVSDKNKATATVSTESIQTNGMVCTDWWLVTTEYYTDGSTNVYSEYLGQTCVGDGGGCLPNEWCTPQPENGGGGGEGGETTYVDDIEYEKKKKIVWTVYVDTGVVTVASVETVKGQPNNEPTKGVFTSVSHDESFIASMPFNWSWQESSSSSNISSGSTVTFGVTGLLKLQFFPAQTKTGSITTTYEECFP